MPFHLSSAAECVQFCNLFFLVFSRIAMKEDFNIKVEQRVVIHFFVQKGKSPNETIDELQNVHTGDELLAAPTIYRWHKAHQEGRQSFTQQKSSGRLVRQITQVFPTHSPEAIRGVTIYTEKLIRIFEMIRIFIRKSSNGTKIQR